jgi:hypothetical protein
VSVFVDVLCSIPPIANPTPVTENNDSGVYGMAIKLGASVGLEWYGDTVGANDGVELGDDDVGKPLGDPDG